MHFDSELLFKMHKIISQYGVQARYRVCNKDYIVFMVDLLICRNHGMVYKLDIEFVIKIILCLWCICYFVGITVWCTS